MSAVREVIIGNILTALAAVSGVARVIESGEDDVRVADVSGTTFVLEVDFGDDFPSNGEAANTAELLSFDVTVLVYLPADLTEFAGATVVKQRRAAAHAMCSRLYLAYSGSAVSDGPFLGVARNVQCTMFCAGLYTGNGVGVVTCQTFRVDYGFVRGDPATAK